MIDRFCSGVIHKIRYTFPAKNGGPLLLDKQLNTLAWEVDEFLGENAGLWVAEIELPAVDTPLTIPNWCGEEISLDLRYSNVTLSQNPYLSWGK